MYAYYLYQLLLWKEAKNLILNKYVDIIYFFLKILLIYWLKYF